MADPLSILRLFKLNRKPILEENDQIVFGEFSWPKSVKTNYLICWPSKKGSSKEYYTLECLLFFLKNAQLPHPVYVQKAQDANIQFVKRPDRKELLSYLSGITNTSASIDKNMPSEVPMKVTQKQNLLEETNMEINSNEINSEDITETSKLLKQAPAVIAEVTDVLQSIKRSFDNGEFDTQKGLSFLDLKNSNLLDYVTNLTYIILKKVNGETIQNDPAIKRLAHLRVMMEKMRPIEEKMKYQVNKLLANVSENDDSHDPLKFRANPDNLDTQEDENDDASEDKKGSKVYVPPKISATYYNEDNIEEQKKKAIEQSQKRALSSSMLYELRKEFDTGPEEIKEMHDPYKLKISEELKERQEFEEEYMMRLPMTKKQRHEMRQLTTVANFNSKFEEMTPENVQLKRKSSTKKGKFKYRGKKKGFKRKH